MEKTKKRALIAEAYLLSRLSRDVLDLGFRSLPESHATHRFDDDDVSEALVRCAAVIGSISVSKLIETFGAEDVVPSTD